MAEQEPDPAPRSVFPPPEFVVRLNAVRLAEGQTMLSSYDPLAMLIWDTITRPPAGPMFRVGGV